MILTIGGRRVAIDAALFDLDGTLAETHIDFPAMKTQTLALCRAYGAEVSSDLDALAIIDAAVSYVRESAPPEEANERADALRRLAFLLLEEIEVTGCANPFEIPGARAFTRTLRDAGVGIGVVTRNCRRISEGLLDQFGIAYDALLTRDDVPLVKPNPAHLLAALSALGASPEQAVMIGDHWMDVQAGRAARCAVTVGVLGARDASWFDRAAPDVIVRDLVDATRLIGTPCEVAA